nr:MAG TPA: hypothetical protein [Caudoviricetes sp.]
MIKGVMVSWRISIMRRQVRDSTGSRIRAIRSMIT